MMSKRRRFVLASLLLAAGLLVTRAVPFDWFYLASLGLGLATFLISFWALAEGLSLARWPAKLVIVSLPTLFATGSALFALFLPPAITDILGVSVSLESGRFLAGVLKIILFGLFGVSLYALFLTENVFSVAAIRNIQLLRAAQAVGFLLSLLTGFFFFEAILSFRFSFWTNFLLVFAVSFPVFAQGLWSITLEERLGRRTQVASFLLAFLLGETALILSFWPVTVTVAALVLTTALYVFLGLARDLFAERLYRRTSYEYIGVGVVVLVAMILTAPWGG